jgi:hypothetical protein
MNKKKWFAAAVVVAVAAVTLGLVFGLTGSQPQSTQPIQASLAPAGAPSEGVQVHGHWTIDVRNPDGSLVNHQEFENSLDSTGNITLAKVLSGNMTAGPWRIWLVTNPFAFRVENDQPAQVGMIEEPCPASTSPTWLNHFYNLTKKGWADGSITLNGSAIAQADGNITAVATRLDLCPNSVPPSLCNCTQTSMEYGAFTLASVALTPLLEGQQVSVEVTLSFH